MLANSAIQELKTNLRGPVLGPGDQGYHATRAVWNGMIDKRPALIACCSGVADVIAAVNFARAHNLPAAVRGGGHNVAGTAVCDDGMMIDLSPMKDIRVDPRARIAYAQGGVTWGELDRETQVFGLATPGGVVSTTGIGGLTLCGGFGYLRRKYGLSCDNLVSVDIVTADGQLRTASEKENADLFWAVRGGGGNFGVVTSLAYRLHPLGPMVMMAAPIYPAAKAASIYRQWREYMQSAPDEVSAHVAIWSIPDLAAFPAETRNQNVIVIAAVYAGPADKGQIVLQPLREFDTPLLDLSGAQPFTAIQNGFDFAFPKDTQRYYWKSLYAETLSDDLFDFLAARAVNRPSPMTLVNTWYMGGAMSRVAPAATAFGSRSAACLIEISSTWVDPEDDARNVAWARQMWADAKRFSNGGVYLNFPGLGEEGEDLVKAAYGANYERLTAIKAQYDPKNMFRFNQNIKPKGS